ncbi:hypothetical protein C8R47DRAFT_1084781 [Mycena vitilis]|nr:hypothetical protein C8R47DRAFT_1084781 [Mycena vitilis]
MPRAGTAQRRRERAGEAEVKRGRKPWVHGSKLVFMRGFKEAYMKASELGKVDSGKFYDDVTNQYLAVYGYNTAYNSDLREGQDVASDVDEDEDVDLLSPEEATERAEYFDEVRGKIGYWFRTEYGGSKSSKKATASFKEVFNMPELGPPRPIRQRVVHFYSRRFYAERIKHRFKAKWAAVSRLDKPPAIITVQNAAIKDAWNSEPEAFKEEVRLSLENEHKAARQAYEIAASGDEPKTPEEFQIALDNAAYYLQPFVDLIQERFGMNVALLMCGPVPNRGGAIEMHSVHAGLSKGLVPRIWPDFDRAGFESTRRSFREFSEECFSTEECDARSLGVMPDVASLEGSQGVEPSSSSNPSGAVGAGGDEERDGDQNSDVSRAAEAEQTKKRSDGGKAKKGKKKKAVAPPGSPKRTRAQGRKDDAVGGDDDDEQEDEQQHTVEKEKTRPRPRPLTRLVRPEDDASAHGPLLENIARPAVAPAAQTPHPPLVRPEDDASAHGPLLEDITRPAVAPAAQTPHPPLVRPEDDASAHGPLRENIARPAVAPAAQTPHPPLVRPEDDASAHGPLRENIARPGAEGEESGDEVLWPDEDRGRWYPDLRGAVSAFGRLAAWGGDEWVECVRRLIVSERAWGFRAAGLLGAMKSRQGRPSEVSKFMTYARKWEVEMDAEAVGPREREDSFAHGWWVWWELLQPKGRRDGEGGLLAAADVDVAEWEVLAKSHGRNGFLLVVACLFWWGSAAAEEGDAALREEWGIAVRDVSAVLGEIVKDVGAMMKSLGDAEKASKKAAKERKKVAEGAAEEESAGRRPRTRGEKRSLDNEKENEKEDGRKKKRRS